MHQILRGLERRARIEIPERAFHVAAAELGALSADHLIAVSPANAVTMGSQLERELQQSRLDALGMQTWADSLRQGLAGVGELPEISDAFGATLTTGRYPDGSDELDYLVIGAPSDSIDGAVELARLYREHLRALVAQGALQSEPERVRLVFERALDRAWALYPDPHTACEAEDFARGRDADLAALVEIAGSDLRRG